MQLLRTESVTSNDKAQIKQLLDRNLSPDQLRMSVAWPERNNKANRYEHMLYLLWDAQRYLFILNNAYLFLRSDLLTQRAALNIESMWLASLQPITEKKTAAPIKRWFLVTMGYVQN